MCAFKLCEIQMLCSAFFFLSFFFLYFFVFLKSNNKMSTEAVVGSQYVLQRDCKKFLLFIMYVKNEVLSRSCTKKG